MITVFYFIVAVFVILVIYFAKKSVKLQESDFENDIIKAEQGYEELIMKKDDLYKEKMDFEEEAIKIFTLYEITKDITKSLNEEEAFEIFKQKLNEHISFKECRFLGPLSNEVRKIKKQDEYFIYTLKGTRKKIGYLYIEGVLEEDKEKVMILGNQFALAMRRVKLYQEIEQIAITDSLTEVRTRRYALERFGEEIKRSQIRKIKMSFIMIDVDHFKNFNDTYGHLTGDQILREIGTIINDNIREIDIAGRYGGEEFCVVLPDTDSQGAQYAAERIRNAADNTSIKAYDTTVNATVSIGISTFPDDAKKMDELIDKADWALYRAKKQGRNRVCSFSLFEDKK